MVLNLIVSDHVERKLIIQCQSLEVAAMNLHDNYMQCMGNKIKLMFMHPDFIMTEFIDRGSLIEISYHRQIQDFKNRDSALEHAW